MKINFTMPLPFPSLYIPFPVKRFLNKLAPNVHNSILRNPPFCSFASFWTVLVTSFNNKSESSRHFTILIISLISSFDIINVAVFPDLAADAAADNP